MSIQKTTTDLSALKINELTQDMYDNALKNGEINSNELYATPFVRDYTVEESSTTLLSGTYEITDLDYYNIYDYDGILIYFSVVEDAPNYINSNYLKITVGEDTYIFSKIDNNDGNNSTPYACYGRGYGDAVDWSDITFCLHLYDNDGTKVKTNGLNIYIKPDYFTSPVTVIIEDYNQTITTTSDFDKAISYVLETNLQSAEGGSY